MKAALRLLLVLVRGSAQVSRWIGMQRTTSSSAFLSASSALVLRIVRALLVFSQLLLRKPGARPAKPADELEEKIDILTQQFQLYRVRLENFEQLALPSKGPTEPPALPALHDFRPATLADRRRSYPEDYSVSLQRMLAEARTDKHQYCDSPDTDSASSFYDESMPPTPTLISSRRPTSRQEKRRSTGLKPLLLPSILAIESATSPPPRYMSRTSWQERPFGYDAMTLPIAEENEILRCDTPCRINEDFDMEEAQFASAYLEDSRGSGGLKLIMAVDASKMLPSIPSKRNFSFVEA